MQSNTNNIEILKSILEKHRQPLFLDSHPWTKCLIVQQAKLDMPELQRKSPGQQLVFTIANLFSQMMPSNPPRRGKRLDTRWGEFGILAAQYFAPLVFGVPVPVSLREAWGHIDESILLFVGGKPGIRLSEEEKEPYKLVGNESSIAPNSTLSDWHRKGLERLMEMILRRESYLSGVVSKPAVIFQDGLPTAYSSRKSSPVNTGQKRVVFLLLGALLLGLLLFDGLRLWKIYNQALIVREDVAQMRALITSPGSRIDQARLAGPALTTLRRDFDALKNQVEPFLLVGRFLRWLPVYGGDLAAAPNLMGMADSMLAAADISYQAVSPLLGETGASGITPAHLTEILAQAQPQLIEADRLINLAKVDRSHMTPDRLTPQIRDLIRNDLDPAITLLEDGLITAEDFPRLMGASAEGPKSYLVLVQNEDELRPTGGFITAVGTLLVDKGQISDLTFANSYDLDNWSKPYPAAPWQLQQYMDTSVLVLRDTSWFTDYPTAALYAETLYSYVDDHTVDGVIAFDQQFLVEILGAIGPIDLEGVGYPIDASNVIAYMRTTKTPYAADRVSNIKDATGMSKAVFMKEIADVVMEKVTSGNVPLEKLGTALVEALNEHHILLKIDSPSITSVLARQRWDGAVRPDGGDFLMVTDTNVGFNKTNVVVQTSLVYDVDLTKPANPVGSLTIVHTNNAAAVICRQASFKPNPPTGEEKYLITDCYWNYMRVYTPSGAKLLESTPQFVPANWMIVKQDVPAKVDNVDEKIEGIQVFGTLQVVPGGESVTTDFQYALPANIIQSGSGQSNYHLLVQKQPGTQAVPITIRVHLPNDASIKAAPPGAVIQKPNILFQTDLRTNIEFDIVFSIP